MRPNPLKTIEFLAGGCVSSEMRKGQDAHNDSTAKRRQSAARRRLYSKNSRGYKRQQDSLGETGGADGLEPATRRERRVRTSASMSEEERAPHGSGTYLFSLMLAYPCFRWNGRKSVELLWSAFSATSHRRCDLRWCLRCPIFDQW